MAEIDYSGKQMAQTQKRPLTTVTLPSVYMYV